MRADDSNHESSSASLSSARPAGDDLAIQLNFDTIDEQQRRRRRSGALFGRLIWWLLVAMALVLAFAAAFPGQLVDWLRLGNYRVDDLRRIFTGGGALAIALIAFGLHHYFSARAKLAKIAGGGHILISPRGLIVQHRSLMDKDLRVGWPLVKAVGIDAGIDPDDVDHDRRFPISSTGGKYLWDRDDTNNLPLTLLSSHPVTPNLVIVFSRPITVRNPAAKLTAAIFGERGKHEPVVAPGAETMTIAILVHVEDVADARSAFLPSGRLRALTPTDFRPPNPAPGR